MLDSIFKEIERVWNLINEGRVSKLKEALKLIKIIEKKGDLKSEERLVCIHLRELVTLGLWRSEEAFRIGEQLHQESKILNKPLFSIDAIYLKFVASYIYGMWYLVVKDIENCENLLKSATDEPKSEIEPREATFYFMEGYLHHFKHEFDLALKLHKKSFAIFKRYKNYSFMLPSCFEILGEIYEGKGELDLALNSHKKGLELSQGKTFL